VALRHVLTVGEHAGVNSGAGRRRTIGAEIADLADQIAGLESGLGDIVRVKREYADDETNTETATILQLFLGVPVRRRRAAAASTGTPIPTCGSNSSTPTGSGRR
jgi:hypothetical protein